MIDSKKSTYVVIHPKLNMRVNSKIQRLAVGTEVVLLDSQAESLVNRRRVISLKDKEKMDLTPKPTDGKAKGK